MEIEKPLNIFYQRLINNYRLGDSAHYSDAIKNSNNKYCFNPFISTECDVQIKLGGIIEEYIISNNLSFSVNAEMKIYGSDFKNARADLTIHEVSKNALYTELDSHMNTLKYAIEIKYANAVNPDYEFKRNLIIPDLDKLHSLRTEVKKIFVFLDEADKLSVSNSDMLIKECNKRSIQLFSNNKCINQKPNYR